MIISFVEGSGTCYSSRECLGYIVSTAAGGGQCCAPGGGLSYTEGRTCQECFSKYCCSNSHMYSVFSLESELFETNIYIQ